MLYRKMNKNIEDSLLSWSILIYMPYANDLSSCAEPIIASISTGMQQGTSVENKLGKVSVYLQRKCRGQAAMRRDFWDSSFCAKQSYCNHISDWAEPSSHNSSSVITFSNFLNWVGTTGLNSSNYLIIILGHGGSILEICPDEDFSSWLSLEDAAIALHSFNLLVKNNLRMLFLQNCCKSSLSAIHSLRSLSAVHVLASPTILAAPNEYYCSLIQSLFVNPNCTALELSARIVGYEPSENYGILACFRINNFLQFLESLNIFFSLRFKLYSDTADSPCIEEILLQLREYINIYHTGKISDRYVDLIGFCKVLHDKAVQVSIDSKEIALLQDSYNAVLNHFKDFAVFVSVSSSFAVKNWCGLSMYFPFGCHSTSLPKSAVAYPFSGLHEPDVQRSLQPLLAIVPTLAALFDLFKSREMQYKEEFEAAVSRYRELSPPSISKGVSVWVSPWMRQQMENSDVNT